MQALKLMITIDNNLPRHLARGPSNSNIPHISLPLGRALSDTDTYPYTPLLYCNCYCVNLIFETCNFVKKKLRKYMGT
jgi:hypothetical protein